MSTQEQNTPTQYRKYNDGYYWFLEYKRTVRVFGIKLFSYWSMVPRPFFDKIWGQQLDCLNTEGNISSSHENLDEFTRRWPDIKLYLKHYQKEQKKLEDESAKWHREKDKDKGKIVSLNTPKPMSHEKNPLPPTHNRQ